LAAPLTLVVMARWPAPGRCKTRLARHTGRLAAAQIQRQLTQHSLAVSGRWSQRHQHKLLMAVDGLGARGLRRWQGQLQALAPGVQLGPQGGGNLGCRMQRQLQRAFQAGAERVIVIGTDLPALETSDLDAAAEALLRAPLVLGPARDGGYWLIGLNRSGFRRAGSRLMSGIPWGSDQVLQRSLAAAAARQLQAVLLRQQNDLDEPSDLEDWLRCQLPPA
jgi:rSAM/selenodomain-associated transferase 1